MAGSVQIFTPERVIDALRDARGIQTVAATLLGCTRLTVANYIQRFPSIAAEIVQIREELKDNLEATLLEKALLDRDTTSVIYALKTYARDRGHGAQDMNVNLNGQIRVQIDLPDAMRRAPQPLGPVPGPQDRLQDVLDDSSPELRAQVVAALPAAIAAAKNGHNGHDATSPA